MENKILEYIKIYGNPDGKIVTWDSLAKMFGFANANTARKYVQRKKQPEEKSVSTDGTWFILGCVHSPFHNKELLDKIISCMHDVKPTGLILNGDFIDMNSLSSHDVGKVPIPGITLQSEYDDTNLLLDKFDQVTSLETKVYIQGNHEARYNKYLKSINNSKLGLALSSPTKALFLEEREYQVLQDYPLSEYQIGDLTVYHGESCSTNVTNSELQKMKRSILFNHTHRLSSFNEGQLQSHNTGQLGDINSAAFSYASRTQRLTQTNAFAIVNVVDNKAYVTPVNCSTGNFYYNGKKY